MRLTGRVAIVTGGAQGLGRVYARRLTAEGARVVIADINASVAESTGAELGCLAIATDVADASSVQAMVEQTLAEHGRIDVLVNNAALFGPLRYQPIEEIDVE